MSKISVLLGALRKGALVFALVTINHPVVAQNRITLRPQLSIPTAELEKIQTIVKQSSAQIIAGPGSVLADTAADADVQVLVKDGDTLSAIVEKLWGPDIKAAGVNYTELTDAIRSKPANKPITDRSNTVLDIRQGDTLYLPRIIAGRQKTGPIVIEVPAAAPNINPAAAANPAAALNPNPATVPAPNPAQPAASVKEQLIAVTNTVSNDGTPIVAALADEATCPKVDGLSPFDRQALLARLVDVRSRQAGILPVSDGQIAVIDSGINGDTGLLLPLMYRSQNADSGSTDGYGFNVPYRSDQLLSLAANSPTPLKHGTHIISLAFGGAEWLSMPAPGNAGNPGSQWKLIPIVIQNEAAAGPVPIRSSDLDLAVNYAANRLAKIVNMSVEAQGVGYLKQIVTPGERRERLYVVAAGNGRMSFNSQRTLNLDVVRMGAEEYWVIPAMRGGTNTSNVITVAAVDKNGEITDFSGYSKSIVDLAALGSCVQGITKLDTNFGASTVEAISGTSQATALVTFGASLVADILGAYAWSPADIKTRLLASSIYIPGLREKVASRGQLSVARAIAARFDILKYEKPDGTTDDLVGDLGDYPGNKDAIGTFKICAKDWAYTTRQILKIVRNGSTKDDATFDFVPIKLKGKLDSIDSTQDPFLWQWQTCSANFDNFRMLRFNPISGPPIDVPYSKIIEIVPRQIAANISK